MNKEIIKPLDLSDEDDYREQMKEAFSAPFTKSDFKRLRRDDLAINILGYETSLTSLKKIKQWINKLEQKIMKLEATK